MPQINFIFFALRPTYRSTFYLGGILRNMSEYLGQVLDICIFRILYFRHRKLPSLFSFIATFGLFGPYGHFFIERLIAKVFGDSLKTIMGIFQLYTGIFVHYQV